MGNALSNAIVQYVIKHPIKTIVHVAKATLLLASSVIASPLLAVAGFTGTGVAAGSLAAAVQSSIGNAVAGGMFATLQSAAMGGSGAAVIAGTLSGAAVAAEGVNVLVSAPKRNEKGREDDE